MEAGKAVGSKHAADGVTERHQLGAVLLLLLLLLPLLCLLFLLFLPLFTLLHCIWGRLAACWIQHSTAANNRPAGTAVRSRPGGCFAAAADGAAAAACTATGAALAAASCIGAAGCQRQEGAAPLVVH